MSRAYIHVTVSTISSIS